MWSVSLPMFLVIMSIAMVSFGAYILQWVHTRHIDWHSCLYMNTLAYMAYMAFEGHVNCWYIHGNNVSCHMMLIVPPMTITFVSLRWLFRGIICFLVPELVPVLMSVSCITGVIWYKSHHITKSYVATHFNCLHLGNAMVPLIMLLASHAMDASANGVTWSKMSCCTSFQLSSSKECNGTTDGTNTVANTITNGITWA